MNRRALVVSTAFVVALVVGAVAVVLLRVDGDPFAGLGAAERAYLLPDAAARGPAAPCGTDTTCAGPLTPSTIAGLSWWSITAWSVAGDGSYRTATVGAGVVPQAVDGRSGGAADATRVQVWRPTADAVDGALADGLEVWVAFVSPLATGAVGDVPPVVEVAVAFDPQGRAAGLGAAGAATVSAPIARAAAAAGAADARGYLLSVIG